LTIEKRRERGTCGEEGLAQFNDAGEGVKRRGMKGLLESDRARLQKGRRQLARIHLLVAASKKE